MMGHTDLPLAGIKVVEMTHMVMGPAAGLMLADMGAEVIKIEPIGGDKTRRLKGSGAGYFAMYNRNKKSIALDIKSAEGQAVVHDLLATADVMIENFRPGALDKLGFGYDTLRTQYPALIYCSEKGFLDGPYQNRTALDEVAQMMGGLAYMTGPPGRPLRAGASVIDVTGGMFGAMAVLAALHDRHRTGEGRRVVASLYETTAFLVGQHMAQYAVTGTPAAPMPARVSAWAVYDVFDMQSGEKVFVGVVSDSQWQAFCNAFGLEDWAEDPAYATNNARIERRPDILDRLRGVFLTYDPGDLIAKLDATGLPYAPISKPEDLSSDPHLLESGGLLDMTLPDGAKVALPALPVSYGGERLQLRMDPPVVNADADSVLAGLGYTESQIAALRASGAVDAAPAAG